MEAQLDALLGSGDFEAIAKVMDDSELEAAGAAAADARFDPEEWPYALHMLGHMINGELENARFGKGHYAHAHAHYNPIPIPVRSSRHSYV